MNKNILTRRIYAFITDLFLALFIGYFFSMIFGEKNNDGNYSVKFPLALIPLSSMLLYFVFQEGYYCKTIGMRLFSLKVKSINSNNYSFLKSLVRHLFDWIDIGLPFFGIALILLTKNGQRLGDKYRIN